MVWSGRLWPVLYSCVLKYHEALLLRVVWASFPGSGNHSQGPEWHCFLACFLSFYSAIFLVPPRTICPRVALPTEDWAALHWSSVRTTPHRHVRRPIWWRQFFTWASLFLLSSQVSTLCVKLTKITWGMRVWGSRRRMTMTPCGRLGTPTPGTERWPPGGL